MMDWVNLIKDLGVPVLYSLVLLWFTINRISVALDKIIDRLDRIQRGQALIARKVGVKGDEYFESLSVLYSPDKISDR